ASTTGPSPSSSRARSGSRCTKRSAGAPSTSARIRCSIRAGSASREAGWECRHYLPGVNPLDQAHDTDGVLDQLRAISTEWLRSRVGSEKGFCMGRFDPEHLARSWVSVAWHPAERQAAAFLTWNQVPARDGWALDLMRRRREAPNGTMEFLIAKSVE